MCSLEESYYPLQQLERIRIDNGFVVESTLLQQSRAYIDTFSQSSPILFSLIDLSFLKQIKHPQKDFIKRVGFISPKAIFLSDRIKRFCRLPYPRKNGSKDCCGGVRKNYLACSPYSPKHSEMKKLLNKGGVFCFIQADGLYDMKQQKYLHEILFETEDFLEHNGVRISMSFSAGPCRICNVCAGQLGEECYLPEKRRYSLESCGIDVDLAMTTMALITGDESWKLSWLKDFGLREKDSRCFKSVMGILVKPPAS